MPAPRNILYLQATSEIGGSDISLLRIVEALDKTRFLPHVVLPADGPLVAELKRHGCKVFILPAMLKLTTRKGAVFFLRYVANYPCAVKKLARLIRKEQIDLVHTNTLHNLYGFLAAKITHRPHVWHAREIVLQSQTVRRVESLLARRYSDRLIVTSDAVGEMFRNGHAAPPNLRKIPNSIDTTRFHPTNDGSALYRDLNLPTTTPLVGLVCRLDPWKGIDTFLQAAALCHQQFPQAHFLVVGGPIIGHENYPNTLERLATELKLNDVVHFTGWKYGPETMPQVHAALNVLVLASKWPEPFGLVLLEAMASGKPIVATNQGGPREICVEGETALLVPPSDPEKMADAILAILRDPTKAQAMGKAGRSRVEQLYDRTHCIKQLETVYDEVLVK